ncbi:disulfide bond formation protein B [Halopseudomonas pelagia]|uniref:disulfide bond formation protein B n=1 Tax=Halopseudomonas pelagia TaxID=553151 RepID=UPI0030D8652C|tara:strand:- start:15 stop:563 length:549 start_codon:yes stop_codon:yes gene_type:complete
MRGKERPIIWYSERPEAGGRVGLLVIAACCLGAVGVALVSQYAFDMQPCPWCVLQRAQFLAIALVCGVALMTQRVVPRLLFCGLALLLSLAGMATALWQHFVANNAFSCSLSLADRIISGLALDQLMPAVLAPRAGCADGRFELWGISYELWSLTLFGIIAGVLGTMVLALCRSVGRGLRSL